MVGIYVITNILNGKIYVGSAKNIEIRFNQHKNALNKNKHHNAHLQYAWNKYGEQSFNFSILEETNLDDLLLKEQYWIDKLEATIKGYNINPTANSRLGSKLSKLQKCNISRALKGRKLSDEHKTKISQNNGFGFTNKRHTSDSLLKISQNNARYWKDRQLSNEHKIKISQNHSKFWKDKNRSDDTKIKISNKLKGKVQNSKLSVEQVKEIKKYLIEKKSNNITWEEIYKQLSQTYNVSINTIRFIKTGRTWADVQLGEV